MKPVGKDTFAVPEDFRASSKKVVLLIVLYWPLPYFFYTGHLEDKVIAVKKCSCQNAYWICSLMRE